MPNTSYRASGQNTYDEMSDVERAQEAARMAAADYAARYGLQSQLAQAEVAKQALANQGMLGAADIGARSASEVAGLHNVGMLGAADIGARSARDVAGIGAQSAKDVAGIGAQSAKDIAGINVGPQQKIADLTEKRYLNEREDTAGQREFDKAIWQRIGGQLGVGQQPAGAQFNVGQAPPNIDDLIAMGIALKTGNPMALPGAGLKQAMNQSMVEKIMSGDYEMGEDGKPVITEQGKRNKQFKSMSGNVGFNMKEMELAQNVLENSAELAPLKNEIHALIANMAPSNMASPSGLLKGGISLITGSPQKLADKVNALMAAAQNAGVPRRAIAMALKKEIQSKMGDMDTAIGGAGADVMKYLDTVK